MGESAAVSAVLSYWNATAMAYRPGLDARRISEFERKNQIVLPEVMRAFYSATDGTMVDGTSGADQHCWCFYPLDEVEPYEHFPWAFVFADYMTESYWLGIDLQGQQDFPFPRGSVYTIGGRGDAIAVSETFEDFLKLYVADDPRLYRSAAFHNALLKDWDNSNGAS